MPSRDEGKKAFETGTNTLAYYKNLLIKVVKISTALGPSLMFAIKAGVYPSYRSNARSLPNLCLLLLLNSFCKSDHKFPNFPKKIPKFSPNFPNFA